MATDLKVDIDADVARFEAGVARAYKALGRLEGQLARADQAAAELDKQLDAEGAQAARRRAETMEKLGRGMVTFGAATLAGLGVASKAALDWESAWTGVLKTVEGSDAELAAIEDGLRGLATELPATHQEIAAVAEAAGQLGISTGGIVDFTRTMVNLGETTNLSADEAATTLARFANIVGTSEGQISNLGSTLVGLGNNFATTEAEIAAMGLRIAGAGVQAGLSEGDILGLAAAMSSVGIEAEAGGTAISTTMTKIGAEIDNNGPKLETFARVAGMSAQQFATAWRTDAAGALAAFVTGLADTSELGMTTNQVLSDLGITGIREADTLRRLSSAQGLLNDALSLGNTAFEENAALVAEAEKRYETAEAKIQIAKNSINDAAITLGETFLPAVAAGAEGVADIAQGFASLPSPVQRAIGVLGAVAGTTATFGGAALLLLPRIRDARTALSDLAAVSPRLASGLSRAQRAGSRMAPVMGRLARGAGAAGAALTVLAASSELVGDQDMSISQYTQALIDLDRTGNGIDLSFGTDLGDAFERITNPNALQRLDDWSGKLTQIVGIRSDAQRFTEDFQQMGEALAHVYDSNPEQAGELFRSVLEATGATVSEQLKLMPAYRDKLTDVAAAQRLGADNAEALAAGLGQVDPAMQAAAESAEEFTERTASAFASFIDPGGAFQAAIDKQRELAEVAAQESASASDSWEDFYDGTTVSVDGFIAELERQVEAQKTWEADVLAISKRMNQQLPADMRDTANAMIDELIELGHEGAAQVALLNSMSDAELRKTVELYGAKGDEASKNFAHEVNSTRPEPIPVDADGTPARREGESTRAYLNRIHAELQVGANTSGAIAAAHAAQRYINSLNATIKGRHVSTGLPSSRSGGDTMATGGPVIGPGTGTSDSIPKWLSNGEHVLTAAEVQALGGHGAVFELRRAALAGKIAASTPASAVPTHAAPAPASAAFDVYVQNPWTGEYLLAQTRTVAVDAVVGGISHELRGQKRGSRYGR